MRANSVLFTPLQCGPMLLKNRFMRSPTWEGLCDDNGFPTKKLLDMMVNLAKGGTGLIIPGYMYPIAHGKAAPRQAGILSKQHAEAWKSTIEKIHSYGAKIVFQIGHGGIRCNPALIGREPIGCSPLLPNTHEMTDLQIDETIEAFAKASKYLENVGADGVQIHAAHGYLVSAFLSPLLNKRKDKWGGIIENRTRFLNELTWAIRSQAKDSFALGIKINGSDCIEGGVTPGMCAENLSLAPAFDFVEISCGLGPKHWTTRANMNIETIKKNHKNPEQLIKQYHEFCDGVPFKKGYNLEAAQFVKSSIPELNVAAVGGWQTFAAMEDAVKSGKIDFISLSRPFLREPNLVNKLYEGGEMSRDHCSLCNENRVDGIHCQNFKK